MGDPPQRTSSSGKTTLARAIQDENDVPYLYWGIDTLFGLVPPNWGGGRDGPLSRDGFWYDRTGRDPDGHPTVVIRCSKVHVSDGADLPRKDFVAGPEVHQPVPDASPHRDSEGERAHRKVLVQ